MIRKLLGAAYTGLRVDIDRVRQDNDARDDVERKAGLIIWSGRESAPASWTQQDNGPLLLVHNMTWDNRVCH